MCLIFAPFPLDRSLYEDFENLAREHVVTRDPDDRADSRSCSSGRLTCRNWHYRCLIPSPGQQGDFYKVEETEESMRAKKISCCGRPANAIEIILAKVGSVDPTFRSSIEPLKRNPKASRLCICLEFPRSSSSSV